MYRTLASEDDYPPLQPVFSIDGLRDSRVERIQGYKTSRRTLLICSIILISTAGLFATWVFIAKPHFYPKLHLAHRSLDYTSNEEIGIINAKFSGYNSYHRKRRSVTDASFVRDEREAKSHNGAGVLNTNATENSIYKKIDDPKEFPYNNSRLPDNLIPEEYHLHVNLIDLEQDNYTGTVKIKLNCEKPTDRIIFHGRRLHPTNITVFSGRTVIPYNKISYIKHFEMFVVDLASKLEEGSLYDLYIEYTVGYGQSLAGLYKSFYTDFGVEKTMVSTHFEPTDARSAFPCLDEPFYKSIFRISITHAKNMTALSNMPIENTEELDGLTVTDRFQMTVKMSTYLVAFTVNDFRFKEKLTEGSEKIKVRVYARSEDHDRIDYALDAATKIIHFYGNFFNISYPLPKLDLLAVPDFLAGAMEDWGLVSFRSAYLIYDPKLSTVEHMRQVALVIAHELAHQWFGNLVTMKWWNDIWLNEGFANFVELVGTNEVNSQFHSLDLQVPYGWSTAISLDSLNSSHPVSQEVEKPSEIDELFDAISYNKGAALLRMVQGFMGEKLRKGVIEYLKAHLYSNAETSDLWRSWSLVSDLNISKIMDTWAKQKSFPLLMVKKINATSYSVRQESFLDAKQKMEEQLDAIKTRNQIENSSLSLGNVKNETNGLTNTTLKNSNNTLNSTILNATITAITANITAIDNLTAINNTKEFVHREFSANESSWRIPFTYITDQNNSESLHWMHEKEIIIKMANSNTKWIKANFHNNGFYIVNYDNTTWLELAKQLRDDHTVISALDRAGIIHDAFKLTCERMLEPKIVLDLIKYMTKEQDLIPFAMLRSKCECLSAMLQDKNLKQKYLKYIWHLQSNLIIPAMVRDRSNVSRFTIFERMQRFQTMLFALKLNISKELKNETEKLFNLMIKKEGVDDISPENRAIALMYGFNPNSTEHINYIWDLFKSSPVDTDRRLLMKSISQFKGHINQTLERAMNSSITRVQDAISLFASLVKNGFRKEVWQYFVKNFDKFHDMYGGGYQMGQLLTEIAGGFSTKDMYKEVSEFLKVHPVGAKDSRTNKLIIEKLHNNINRHANGTANKMVADAVKSWLEEQGDDTTSKRTITLIG